MKTLERVQISRRLLKRIPELFADVTVSRSFVCSENYIQSLVNSPRRVEGTFDCSFNRNLRSLVGGPMYVGETYDCVHCGLLSLKGVPRIIYGNFYCGDNPLTTLEDMPEIVHGVVNIVNTKFTLKDVMKYCDAGIIYTNHGRFTPDG